jgi:hypothetical protein
MSTAGFSDPDVIALRIQRLERVMKFVFEQVYNRDNRDINVAKDVNAMAMDLQREIAISPPVYDLF